jgi:hypothetical protein
MLKLAGQTSAIDARPAPAGRSVDLAGAVGLLAAALARARELPGRAADAAEMGARLEALRSDLEVCLARARCEAATEGRLGREFGARRARAHALALAEEIEDVDAMLEEVERVARRVRREARAVDHRLAMCAALVAELPPCPERARALALVERARAELSAAPGGTQASAALDALYTLTRGELKQSGHAR